MFKNLKRATAMALCGAMAIGALAGCGSKDTGNTSDPSSTTGTTTQAPASNSQTSAGDTATPTAEPTKAPFYLSLDKNISGSIDVMVWSGDGEYHEDIGHANWGRENEEIRALNVAAVYAMAEKFNQIYPNVKINLYSKKDDPNANDTTWRQELENFKAQHGKYPDIYAANDLPNDLADGMVADLSVYADDVLYQQFNQGIMSTMNYYGFQAGIPQFVEPWAIYVNKELAETNNITVPDPDWDIDEYTKFVCHSGSDWWGTINGSVAHLIETGTNTVNAQMASYSGTGDRVNIASDEVMDLLSYIPKWCDYELWTNYWGRGTVDQSIVDDGWWWGFRFFCRNRVLAYEGDPWMLNTAGLPQNADGSWPVNSVESNDWDIYPRPATDYKGNTVGICVDPMAIHNFAMDDGNPAWSDAEKANLDLAYAFGSYWVGTTEAMQARADQNYYDFNETLGQGEFKSCLNDSFPLITGEEFDKQMAIWFSSDAHARYADKDKMPGFQYCLKLWEEGQIWDISDKTYPYYVYEDGDQTACLYEWLNLTNADVVGVGVLEPSWLDTVKAKLPEWNREINERFKEAEVTIKNGLVNYYGFTEKDFQ